MLALTAALVAPYFIDWSSYRSAFEREAGRILGRPVQVEGTARARLLPFPSVTFTDVVVAGGEPGTPAMTVDEFSMDAELAPFLRGEVLIFDMRLVRPSATIEIGADGGVDWAVRSSSPLDPRQVTLEKVTILDGTIDIHQQASGRTMRLASINSELSARSLAGPWRVDGSLDIDGTPVALSAATGMGEDGRMRVRISAAPRQYPFALTTDGHAEFIDGEGRYAGTFRLRTTEAQEAAQEEASANAADNRVSGLFTLDHRQLVVDEFRFETGPEDDPYTADGRAVVSLGAEPSFSITADGAQIRLDGAAEGGEGISGASAGKRLAALTDFMANLPKPNIPGIVAVNLPAIVVGDTTVRNIRIEAEPVAQGWNVRSAAATLPGRTRFEGSGLLATEGALSFNGNIILAVGQPSGFAAWLARDVDEAIRRLPAAGFSADVSLTQERQTFDNLELILGDARFHGAIDRRNQSDARPSLLLKLDGGRLDIDGMQAFASLFVDSTGRNRLSDHDVDLEISAGPVSTQGLAAERLETALRLREGELEIDKLTIAGLAGARISATGRIRGIGAEPTGRVDATLIAVDLAPLVELLATRLPGNRLLSALDRHAEAYPGLLSDSEVNIVASAAADDGDTSSLAISTDGTAGGTAFSLSLSGSGTLTDVPDAHSTVNFTARNDEAAALYALFGLPSLPLDLAGGAELDITATGTLAQGMATTAHISGEGLVADFEGEIATDSEGVNAKGHAKIQSEDMEPWLAAAGVSFPGFGFGLPVELSADIEYSNELAVMNDVTGHVAGSAVSGDLNGELREGVPHLTGDLSLGTLDLGLGAEMIAGSAALQADRGLWAQTPFQQSARVPFSADVALDVDRLWIGDAAEARDARLNLALEAGRFAVSDLSAQLFGGSIEGLAELQNTDGTGLVSAQFSLENAVLERLLPDTRVAGRTDLNASVTASGKSVNAMVASLAGSGSAAVKDIRISGIDNAAFQDVLDHADRLGVGVDAENVDAFAPQLVRGGGFAANDAKFAFTIANGVARTPPVQLDSTGASMSVEAAADFRDKTVSANGSITYDAGREALAGAEPVVRFSAAGPVGGARLALDTGPLAQYLTQRALEREQARVEHMQAVLLEAQRLRREVRYFQAREVERRAKQAERVRLERQAEAQRKAHAERERQRQAEEEAARRREQNASPTEEQGGDVAPEPSAPPSGPEPQEDGATVEQEALPPRGGDAGALDAPEPGFRVDSLSVEKLLELLDPQGQE